MFKTFCGLNGSFSRAAAIYSDRKEALEGSSQEVTTPRGRGHNNNTRQENFAIISRARLGALLGARAIRGI